MKHKILIIDDEAAIRDVFSLLLEEKDYQVASAATAEAGIASARRFCPDIVLLDMNLPDLPGLEALARIKEIAPAPEIVIITAYGTIRNAVEAVKLGAYAYLEKPIDNDELLLTVARIAEVRKLAGEVKALKSELLSRFRFSSIVGLGPKMSSVFQLMEKMAKVDGTVLITGESGTGKELAAKAVHYNSPRKDHPFVVVNCGAIPRELIESEFFGHVKGAFTDAKTEQTGKFESAHRGTIFLDEIGDLSQDAQVKLLRALGEKEIMKVGGTKTIPVDVRVIAATNKDLESEVQNGRFREDLYFRLAVLSLRLPPLRERLVDLPLLCEHFIRKYGEELEKPAEGISPEAVACLRRYSWPGNVRELENVIYEALVLCEGNLIGIKDLPHRIRAFYADEPVARADASDGNARSLKDRVQGVVGRTEQKCIEDALIQARGNRTEAAKILGVSRKTLFNKMLQLGIKTGERH